MATNSTHIHPLDLDDNIAIGLSLPLNSDETSFFKLNYTTKEQIKTNLKMLLLTIPGERIMQPTYGTNIRKILFEQENSNFIQFIKDDVIDSIDMWLPYITVEDISLTKDSDKQVIYFKIDYSIIATSENDGLTITL